MAKILLVAVLAVICYAGLTESRYVPSAYQEDLGRSVDVSQFEESNDDEYQQYDESAVEDQEEVARGFVNEMQQYLREIRELENGSESDSEAEPKPRPSKRKKFRKYI